MEEKHCKWYNDEFCTNDKSPCVADYCPVVEYPELCKHREFDKDINVRSKDDTEIDVGMIEQTIEIEDLMIEFDEMGFYPLTTCSNAEAYTIDYKKRVLDLFNRLKSEKSEYERKLANGELVPVKELVDKGELVSIDWHNEQVLHDANVIEEQKAEIERLTEAMSDFRQEVITLNIEKLELQKQVDKLKIEIKLEKEWGDIKVAQALADFKIWKQQVVKDTAKEILQTIKHAKENGQIFYNEAFMITAQKAYGVEVE